MDDDDSRPGEVDRGEVDRGFRRTLMRHVEAAELDGTALATPATLRAVATRRRRTRFAGLLTATAVASIVATVHAGPLIGRNPATGRTVTATATATVPPLQIDLPANSGHGPGIEHFTAPGYTPGVWVRGVHDWQHVPVRGSMTTIGRTASGDRLVLFTTLNGFLCTGRVAVGQKHPEPQGCQALAGLPAEGFFGSHGASLSADASPSASDPLITFGVVRGPVTRVVVRTRGVDVEATLAPAQPADLGTFYWASVAAAPSDVPGPSPFELVAYEGDQPRFRCTADERVCKRTP